MSARGLALDVTERVLGGAYLAPTLHHTLSASRLEGPDRSLVTDVCYGVIRRLKQVDHALTPLLTAPDKLPVRVRAALRLGAYEVLYRETPRYAAVSAWVDEVKGGHPRLAGLANAVLRRVTKSGDDAPEDVKASLPLWLLDELVAALGAGAASQAAQGMLEPEPLWLTLLGPDAVTLLKQDGVEAAPLLAGAPFPASYRARSPMPLGQLQAFKRGHVQPQNPSSLQAALALGAGAADSVYDLASGRGVKAAVFAAQGAAVTGFELSPSRVEAARRNLRRLGLEAEHVVADLTVKPEVPPVPRVILDAPCSGTGTLRGHPEIKLRLTSTDLTRLAELQRALLANAAQLVAPGGRLVYAVCALTNAEGPEVVASFLGSARGFEPEETALPLASVEPAGGQPGRFILPIDGLDGFYVAVLRRT